VSVGIGSKVEGLKELNKKLKGMSADLQGKYLQQSMGFAMTPVVKSARENAPRGERYHKTYKGRIVAPGFLSRSIRKKTMRAKPGRLPRAVVGVKKEAYYGPAFVEKGIRGKKRVPEDNFLTDAFYSNLNDVRGRFRKKLRNKIDEYKK
jgi:hypothetical protein